jgi:ArsR family transcriptional regulator
MLQDGERCVCDLQGELDAAQSRLSFHLKVLREAGLVTDRKEGRWSYDTIVPEALAIAHDLVVDMRPAASGSRLRLPANARRCGSRSFIASLSRVQYVNISCSETLP